MTRVEPEVVHARFLVVREMPMLVVDLEGDAPDLPLVADNLLRTVTEAGLAVLPAFYGVTFPKGARVGWTLAADELRLEDEQETVHLRIARATVDPVWEAAALRLKGTMLAVGWNLGLDPDDSDHAACDRLDAAARRGDVAAAVVGVAEPREGLPLLFG